MTPPSRACSVPLLKKLPYNCKTPPSRACITPLLMFVSDGTAVTERLCGAEPFGVPATSMRPALIRPCDTVRTFAIANCPPFSTDSLLIDAGTSKVMKDPLDIETSYCKSTDSLRWAIGKVIRSAHVQVIGISKDIPPLLGPFPKLAAKSNGGLGS